MKKLKTTLVITSIADENKILRDYSAECLKRKIEFFLIGDTKSPEHFHIEGCSYFSIAQQEKLSFELVKTLPVKHYARKNIGYLLAIQNKADVILETDDDNIPYSAFWKISNAHASCYQFSEKGWLNIYAYYSSKKIWPRGFPLELLDEKVPVLESEIKKNLFCPIQQGLADDNPDVDAVFRLTYSLPIKFKKGKPIAISGKTWCPFNSQNTRWFKPAFPLLYLPSYCSFRMTDIWRSFVAQRICYENNWNVLFHKATVYQLRNEHNLLRDFEDEVSGYLNNSKIINTLQHLKLKNGEVNIAANLIKCYESLIKMGLVKEAELNLLHAWCADIKIM